MYVCIHVCTYTRTTTTALSVSDSGMPRYVSSGIAEAEACLDTLAQAEASKASRASLHRRRMLLMPLRFT
jgi:hypothetical protein